MLLGAVLAAGVAGCGTGKSTATGSAGHGGPHRLAHLATARPVTARAAHLVYHPLYALAAPLRDPASAVLDRGRFVLVGGLDGADASSAGIEVAGLRGVLRTGSLPLAQHDAQGAELDGQVYVFGGGSFSELNHIISFDPATGSVHGVGILPHAESDVAVTASGGTAYVVGGYDGASWLNTILAWRPGSGVHVVGHLPVGLRYATASAVGGRVLIAGGSTPTGASSAVYSFDPDSGLVRRIGRLPDPLTHAASATLGRYVYVIGGRGDSLVSQTADIWSVDPLTGAVRFAGRLPEPLSDTGVQALGGVIVVAGGLSPQSTVSAVGELIPSGA